MLFAGVRARALSGSTPDYPDDEHETLCGCLCLRVTVCLFVFVWPSRKGSDNELLNFFELLYRYQLTHTAQKIVENIYTCFPLSFTALVSFVPLVERVF